MASATVTFRNEAGLGARSWLLLPIQLKCKLELARIECGCRLSRIGVERADVCYVEPVHDIEHIHDAIQLHAFREVDALGDADVIEDCPRFYGGVASKIAGKLAGKVTRQLEESRRRKA